MRLKELIRSKGFTQRELADELELNENYLNQKLNGHAPFTQKQIKYLSDRLNLTAQEITDFFIYSNR